MEFSMSIRTEKNKSLNFCIDNKHIELHSKVVTLAFFFLNGFTQNLPFIVNIGWTFLGETSILNVYCTHIGSKFYECLVLMLLFSRIYKNKNKKEKKRKK
jgi:hypothetical protein